VVVEENPDAKGLAFVVHGFGGTKDERHIRTFCETFEKNGLTVVSFDTTNSFGESDGNYEDATVTNYYEDFQDVILWARTQNWYQEPFWLAGHSTGGMLVVLYAEEHPKEVKALAPISTDVAGVLCLETKNFSPEILERWEAAGIRETKGIADPALIKRLKWQYIPDSIKYDVRPKAHTLSIPILMIVGEKDESTPLEHCQILYDLLPGPKELHVIKDAPHTFKDPKHLAEIKGIMDKWIKKNL